MCVCVCVCKFNPIFYIPSKKMYCYNIFTFGNKVKCVLKYGKLVYFSTMWK